MARKPRDRSGWGEMALDAMRKREGDVASETWEFDEWFKAQHGHCPSSAAVARLRDRVESQRRILANDEADLRALEELLARHTSAFYAWQVKDAQKRSSRGE